MAPVSRDTIPFFPFLLVLTICSVFVIQLVFQEPQRIHPDVPQSGDVAVLGGSSAAILTALEASRGGAEVYLFPLGQELAGDAPYLAIEGLAAAGTAAQEEQGLEMTPALLRQNISDRGQGLSVPSLLDAFEELAPRLPEEALRFGGVEFNRLPLLETYPHLHLAHSPADNARTFQESLLENLQNSAVFINQAEVTEILLSPEGRVEGLLLQNGEEEQQTFYVQAAVLATGGYSADLDRWHHFTGEEMVPLRPGQTGKGLLMAEELGVEVIQEGYYNRRPVLCPPGENENGESSCAVLPYSVLEQPGLYVLGEGTYIPVSELDGMDELLQRAHPQGEGIFVAAEDRPDVLLGQGGVWQTHNSVEALLESTGTPDATGLPPGLEAPLYSATLGTAVDYTLGGLPVTAGGEVILEGSTLEGLFAAGEIAGGLHGTSMLPGMPLSETLFFSRAAGREAAAYVSR